ncbi:beta strand repeat-containing protein [Qipengyuania sp. CAU 1752]
MIKTPITRCSISARLLVGSSMALALACISQVAHAQSFQASADVVAGDAIISTGANVTDIQVNTSEVVINWTPTDTSAPAVIDFQPIGTTANFFADSSANFTVLNRIIPVDANGAPVASAVAFNGTVNSYLLASVNNPGGNIWFYSPTGIIVGATGVFNVGSLILTTNDIAFGETNTGGTTLFGPTGEVLFRGPVNSTGLVQIDAGAQINALGGAASYIALVAPRLVQAGTVSADGSIAYVAAEELDLTINAGLFDINILTGTTDPNGLVHTGTTTGPASTAAADRQIISMVALPKNATLTMLLGGSIGYTPAAVAANDGSAVILSAGYDGFDAAGQPLAESPDNFGNIDISDAVFSNRVDGFASGRIDVSPAGGSVDFASDVSLYAQQAISMVADVNESITIGGGLTLASSQASQGGAIDLIAQGGTIDAATSLNVDVSSDAGPFSSAAPLGGFGGTVNLLAEGAGGIAGSVAAPFVSFRADGFGTEDAVPTGGSDGFGGTVTLTAGALGNLSFGNLLASASGFGGGSGQLAAGDGFGGDISLLDRGGSLAFGSVSLFANGGGGFGPAEGGAGFGGRITVDITSQPQDWVSLFADANAFGVLPQTMGGIGGQAVGDPNAIALSVSGPGSLNIQQTFDLRADAISGVDLAPGLTGAAGGIAIDVLNGGALTINGLLSAHADARIATEGPGFPSNTSPDQFGGTIDVTVDGGTIIANQMVLSADSESTSAAVAAGDAFGGIVALTITAGGNVTLLGDSTTDVLELRANAAGFSGIQASDAFGGLSRITIDGGTLDVAGNINVLANADQGVGGFVAGQGFSASGGSALVELGANGGTLSAADLNVIALGSAGIDGVEEDAGDGRGGIAAFNVNGGTVDLNNVFIRAEGIGGTSGFSTNATQGQSGDGFGGTAALTQTAGMINANVIFVSSRASGGGRAAPGGLGGTTPLAGNGTGGDTQVRLAGGTLTTNVLALSAIAFGGQGHDDLDLDPATAAGDGGNATGGDAQLIMDPGSTATLNSGSTLIVASAFGGTGGTSADPVPVNGDGGNANGGTALSMIADGSFDMGATQIAANGAGGGGEVGGNGTGGTSGIALQDTIAGTAARTFASLAIEADGVAGAGAATAGTATAGATVIDLTMLDPSSGPAITGDLSVFATGAVAPAGDGLTAQISGGALAVGGNATIITSRDVTLAIAADALLDVAGTLYIAAREATTSGLIASGGDASIIAPVGISMTDLSSAGATLLQSLGGPVSVTNDLSSAGLVTAIGTSIDLRALSTLDIADVQASAGDIVLTVDGAANDLIIAQANAVGAVTGSTTGGSIAINGPISGTNVTLTAGDALTATGDVTATSGAIRMIAGSTLNSVGVLDAATDVTLDAATALTQDGAIIAGGDASLTAGTDLFSNGPVSAANVTMNAGDALASTGNVTATSGAIQMIAGSALNSVGVLDAATDVTLDAATALTHDGAIVAGGDALLTAGTDLFSNGTIDAGANVALAAGADLATTNDVISGGSATFTAGGDASILGDVFAATDADFIAGGGLAVDATVIGTRINGTSSAIDLGAAAQLGVLGITQSVALTNSDAVGNTFVGGADVANSYSLTQAELGRIAADNSLTVSSTGSGLFSLGDFTVATGIGGSLGDRGTLALLSAGDLFVAGMARLDTGDPVSILQLKGQQVVVSANTGSLKISDAAGTLSGVLQIESQSLIVAGSAALADLASAADLTEASDRLGVADGTPTDDGYLQARSINISATDRIFIQNSGAGEEFVDRRGFTAGELNIDTASPATQIAINGVILSAGSRVTGLETQPLVTINGSTAAPGGRFDPLSTINGCIIGLACRLQIVPLDPLNEDQLKGVTPEGDPSGGRSLVGKAMVIEIRENEPLVKPPLIDEPITGVGNDDFWLRPCDSEADVDCPVEEGVQ